jgi:hypothetical protein
MKKLLREQMKKVIGGAIPPAKNCACADGTAGVGDTCSITTNNCARKCKCDYTCRDQGNELGSKCVSIPA